MALPKYKVSKARTRARRAINIRVDLPNLSLCPKCGEKKLPHRVCPKCGFYRDRDVLNLGGSQD
jgi:large subunit ribosomal protein L32